MMIPTAFGEVKPFLVQMKQELILLYSTVLKENLPTRAFNLCS